MVKEIDITKRKIGINFRADQAEILLWAPLAKQVVLNNISTGLQLNLQEAIFGYWELETATLKPGERYAFELQFDQETKTLPDPASLAQPDGVHESSASFDVNDYPWTDQNWKPIPLENDIIYELHTGTFSGEGTFYGIEQKLDDLLDLGITAIEIMPISQFPGNRNWGYDGVFPFAVQESYGGAIGLQHLVNVCHQKGLTVILDVVYNHFGPEGNYFSNFGPYFTDKYHTPWGDAINFDDSQCDGVRHFFIENALMWLRDFHIDALRLDAVHAIKDLSAKHFLQDLKEQVNRLSAFTGRKYQLIVECDLNDHKFIDPIASNGYGMDGQWIDEFHHALRVAAGQKRNGYYADFNGIKHLAKSYKDAYVYDGCYSEERQKTFGTKATANEGKQFVVFSQNHDQVGNRALGERTSALHSFEMQKVMFGAVMLSPFVPLLFMGEEYGETNPFLYFISHGDTKLINEVRKGRKKEFEAFHLDEKVPDPQAEETFHQSKLQWDLRNEGQHQALLQYYKELITLRKNNIVLNHLDRNTINSFAFEAQNCLIIERWQNEEYLIGILNFSSEVQELKFTLKGQAWHKIFDSNNDLYGGKIEANQMLKTNEMIKIQAETFLIYVNHV